MKAISMLVTVHHWFKDYYYVSVKHSNPQLDHLTLESPPLSRDEAYELAYNLTNHTTTQPTNKYNLTPTQLIQPSLPNQTG